MLKLRTFGGIVSGEGGEGWYSASVGNVSAAVQANASLYPYSGTHATAGCDLSCVHALLVATPLEARESTEAADIVVDVSGA